MKTDIEIAQEASLLPIPEIAARLGIRQAVLAYPEVDDLLPDLLEGLES